jgi:diguanylate cyclase (GGDEF)-like protein
MAALDLATLKRLLSRTLEGELAELPVQERREQHRRQIQMLHAPLSNLLLALAVIGLGRVLAESLTGWESLPALVWQAAAALVMLAMALGYRSLVSLRRRVLLGLLFLALLLTSLLEPGNPWRELPALSLAGLLLLPVAGLPLLVRPALAFGVLAACTALTAWMLFSLTEVSAAERQTFAFYYLVSATAGLVLRRARANLAVRVDKQVESLWQRAVTDPLTGLLNRHGWLNLAGTAMQDALDAGQVPAVLFIDVDHFKRVNDAHGHHTGDELLCALGGIISARIGPGQFAARLGGEEFACLLPRCSVAQAERFAERLANDYRERAARYDSTLSIGVATYSDGDVLNDLLARADAALYEAKHRGRDRIIVAR